MEKKDVPVLLLTGYLGSGKTTLVNRILGNRKGIKFAVIVNDLGEVNIDADLIQAGGVVAQKDDSLVALQNGCICCTLKADLVAQVFDLMKSGKFDYIVIEASGICEPEPIAQTICSIPTLGGPYTQYGNCRLDCIVTVVDALRLRDEFGAGDELTKKDIGEEDISNLIIQQIEFCNIILLNKASEVKPEELEKIRTIIRTLQPGAEIIDCNYADVDLDKILDTKMFNFDKAAMSAGWIRGIESRPTDEEEEEARNHGHHHHHHHHDGEQRHCHEEGHGHHHHHHDEGEAEEYGISTFVYYRRPAFDINKFDYFVTKKWPKSVIRAKGICYFSDERGMSYLFEPETAQTVRTMVCHSS
jgi:G3E family GTPase